MEYNRFRVISDLVPTGDQPQAIEKVSESILSNNKFTTLLGVTGSGKTFTMANVIEKIQLPTLVISPNKALAAQLYNEFKEVFPNNKVEFFVSYYDYYRPEAYIPTKDIYIEKETDINEIIQKMRLSTLKSVITRRDVVVVASVSCIYASGDPRDFREINLRLVKGERLEHRNLLRKLAKMRYERTNGELERGKFRLRGDKLEIFPNYEDLCIGVDFFDDEIDAIYTFDPVNRRRVEEYDSTLIFPAKEFITTEDAINNALSSIEKELKERLEEFKSQGKYLEAERLEQRTRFDMESMKEIGYCPGIENYSRHFSGKKPGEPPWTLLDYFPEDYLVFIDESHITVPQLRAMANGDRARKKSLVDYGFRLPSAYDNRPLRFDEFIERVPRVVFVSATPGAYEMEVSAQVVEQIIRPTGLVDPEVEVRPTEGQIDDLIKEINLRKEKNERALVTTLTKRSAERLSDYLGEMGINSLYLHSDIDTIERVKILRKLRKGEIDVVVGINLLREGLDLPEVSLVAILDADKEGYLRSEVSLIQTMGRTARNVNGKVIMYADTITDAMKRAIEETNRRRKIQMEYNTIHRITPKTIIKPVEEGMFEEFGYKEKKVKVKRSKAIEELFSLTNVLGREEYIQVLQDEMTRAASELRFEDAAQIRDELIKLRKR